MVLAVTAASSGRSHHPALVLLRLSAEVWVKAQLKYSFPSVQPFAHWLAYWSLLRRPMGLTTRSRRRWQVGFYWVQLAHRQVEEH